MAEKASSKTPVYLSRSAAIITVMKACLRSARLSDVDSMYEISCQAHLDDVYESLIPIKSYSKFKSAYTPNDQKRQQFRQKISDFILGDESKAWVYEASERVVGYTMARCENGAWRLKGLFVLPEFQGAGIGRQLFRESYGAAPAGLAVELKVIAGNSRAVKIYEKEGFVKTGLASEKFFGAEQINMRLA